MKAALIAFVLTTVIVNAVYYHYRTQKAEIAQQHRAMQFGEKPRQ